ncbi:zinc finger protein 282-like [Ambystoma mexicanum]|uniref:zinc finger protein 282-like n=1 Tax=Ambystoma mexicanum TaxID=8296 RepID=UPI0037E7A7CD
MSQSDTDQTQGSFLDASVYFSEEEWKLLQEWQKELYRNVMKEIHQALTSLGPIIAATVSSLRAKEKEEHCLAEDQYPESQQRVNHTLNETMVHNDVLFKKTYEEHLHLSHPQDSDGRESSDRLSIGFPFLNGDIYLRKEEPDAMLIDHLCAGMGEGRMNPSSGYEVVSFRIKDEEDIYCTYDQDSKRLKRTQNHSGEENMSRKKKVGDALKGSERAPHCKASSEKINPIVLQSCKKEDHSRKPMWSASYPELGGESNAQPESSFSNAPHFSLHPGSASTGRSNVYSDCESSPRSSQPPKEAPNSQLIQRTHTSIGSDAACSVKGPPPPHARSNSRAEPPSAANECERSFFHKSRPLTQQRINSDEKPHACTFCHKRFNRRYNLLDHIRIHTGERPYKCTKCEKSFIQKSHLNEHLRKHA